MPARRPEPPKTPPARGRIPITESERARAANPWLVRILVLAVMTVLLFIVWNSAWAQSSDWVDPATDIIDDIGAGMQLLGGALLGIAVAVVGIMAMVSGRINWQWVIAILVGGVLVFLGGTGVKELLGP